MIVGVGVDVVDIARFEATLERTPSLRERLFTPAEALLPVPSLAARFAAKEAIAKALGAPKGMGWHDAEIIREDSGRPVFEIRGSVLEVAASLGVSSVHVSLSHDGGLAAAYVVLEG